MRNDWQVLRFIFIASVLSIPSQQSAHGQNFGGGGFNQQINNQNLGGAIFANKAPIAPINPNLGNNGPKSFNPALQNFGQIGGANLPRQGGPNSFLMNGPKMGPQAGPNRSFQNGPNSFDRTVNNLVPMSGVNLPVQGQNSFFLPGNNVGPLAGVNPQTYGAATLQPPILNQGTATLQPQILNQGAAPFQPQILNQGTAALQPQILNQGAAPFQPQILNQGAATLQPQILNQGAAGSGISLPTGPQQVVTEVKGTIVVHAAGPASALPSGFTEVLSVNGLKAVDGGSRPLVNGPSSSIQLGNVDARVMNSNNSIITVENERAQLILFSSASQVLYGAKGQKLIGKPGTVISRKRSVVLLHSGALMAHSGQHHLEIETAQGIIDMPENSNAVIELEPGKPLRVIPLNTSVSVRGLINAPTRTVHAAVGDELIVAEKDDAELDLIPVDGLSRTVVTGGIEHVGGLRGSSTHLQSEPTVAHAKLRSGRAVRLAGGTMDEKTQSILSQIAPDWKFGACASGSQADGTPLQFVVAPHSQFECSDGNGFKLIEGVALLAAPTAVTVDLPIGKVKAAKGVVMMLESRGGIYRVKAFNSVGDVKVAFKDQMVPLNGGEELVLADHVLSAATLNPGDYIARRPSSAVTNLDTVSYALNEFSITSFLKIRPCYESLHNLDPNRQLTSAVLKAAVVVDMVKRAHGQYVYGESESRLATK